MEYCRRCLYPANHPLGLTFDSEGVCSGCRVHEEKDALDWSERRQALEGIIDEHRDQTGRNYDCVAPVSGARDSYFIVHTLVKEFGVRPLLVTYNHEYATKVGLRNLAYLRTMFNCDHLNHPLSPDLLKRVTRKTLRERASMYWHVLAGSTVFPVQVAVRFRIPLIVWGAHQGIDQVGMFSHLDGVEMTRKYRKEHDLLGLEAEDLVDEEMGLTEADLQPFAYPEDPELASVGVRGIYLNNYIRWDTKAQHESMIKRYGYETAPQQRTFDTYNHVDCHHYAGVHDWIKFLKWGYGKATDHACREIRLKRMTREEGIDQVKKFQWARPQDLPLFLSWLGITEDEFNAQVDRHRDPRVWTKGSQGWSLLDSVVNHVDDEGVDPVRLPRVEEAHFQVTPPRDRAPDERQEIMIKGFVPGWRPPA